MANPFTPSPQLSQLMRDQSGQPETESRYAQEVRDFYSPQITDILGRGASQAGLQPNQVYSPELAAYLGSQLAIGTDPDTLAAQLPQSGEFKQAFQKAQTTGQTLTPAPAPAEKLNDIFYGREAIKRQQPQIADTLTAFKQASGGYDFPNNEEPIQRLIASQVEAGTPQEKIVQSLFGTGEYQEARRQNPNLPGQPIDRVAALNSPIVQQVSQLVPNLPSFQQFQFQPIKSFSEVYGQLYQNLGLDQVKTRVDDVLGQMNDLENQRQQAIQNVNHNPWLTESNRRTQLQETNGKFDQQKSTLANQLSLYQHTFDQSREDARLMAQETLKQMTGDREFQGQQLDRAIKLAESQAAANRDIYKFQSNQAQNERQFQQNFGLSQQKFGFEQDKFNAGLENQKNQLQLELAKLGLAQNTEAQRAYQFEREQNLKEQLAAGQRRAQRSSSQGGVESGRLYLSKDDQQDLVAAHVDPNDQNAMALFINAPPAFKKMFITNLQSSLKAAPNQAFFDVNSINDNLKAWQATQTQKKTSKAGGSFRTDKSLE